MERQLKRGKYVCSLAYTYIFKKKHAQCNWEGRMLASSTSENVIRKPAYGVLFIFLEHELHLPVVRTFTTITSTAFD